MSVNVRLMRVSTRFTGIADVMWINASQVDDLTGMQACNLQNLPENYTMKYCSSVHPPLLLAEAL